MNIFLAVLLGGFFGFALYYVGVTQSKNLKDMLSLRDLGLMKIIIFAIGFASFLVSLASFMGIFDTSHLSVKTTHLGVVLGGLIFGIGFGWAGTCPGTCVADSSSGGLSKAIFIILGGLIGAFVYAISYESLDNLGLFDKMNPGNLTLFNLSDNFPSVFKLGFIGLLIMGILIMGVALLLPEHFSLEE